MPVSFWPIGVCSVTSADSDCCVAAEDETEDSEALIIVSLQIVAPPCFCTMDRTLEYAPESAPAISTSATHSPLSRPDTSWSAVPVMYLSCWSICVLSSLIWFCWLLIWSLRWDRSLRRLSATPFDRIEAPITRPTVSARKIATIDTTW